MSKLCPISHSIVLYLDCLECDDKMCKQYKRAPRTAKYNVRGGDKIKIKYGQTVTISVGDDNDTMTLLYCGKYKNKRLLYELNYGKGQYYLVNDDFFAKHKLIKASGKIFVSLADIKRDKIIKNKRGVKTWDD